MNNKKFFPRLNFKSKVLINKTINKNSKVISQLKRKADFNFSDNETDDFKINNESVMLKDGNALKSIPDKFPFKNLVMKKSIDKVDFNAPLVNQKICYSTNEDKLKLLEELDSCIKIKDYQGLNRPLISGTCLDMCPEKERYLRECQDNVSIFERNENNQFDHRRAVKEYERCSIDQKESQPHELRPSEVLQRTMNYLLVHVVDNERVSWRQWYNFLLDRTRSIRKDITQQNLCNETAVNIVETITRFHIFCSAWLCVEAKDSFDPRLNDNHLKNCLQTLKNMYADMPAGSCENEPEFRSYMIILNLDKGEILDEAQKLTTRVFYSPKLTFALEVCQAISTNNYVRFFRLLEQSDLILSCLLHRFIVPMRLRAFEVINKAYVTNKSTENKVNQIPLSTISRQLKFENSGEILEFCHAINQELSDFTENQMIILNYFPLEVNNKEKLISKSNLLVEGKQGQKKLSSIFSGDQRDLDLDLCIPDCKMVSFDGNGCYIGPKQVPQKQDTSKPCEDIVVCIDSSEEDVEIIDNSSSPIDSINYGSPNFHISKEEHPVSSSTKPSSMDLSSVPIKINLFPIISSSSGPSLSIFASNRDSVTSASQSTLFGQFSNRRDNQNTPLFNGNENFTVKPKVNLFQSHENDLKCFESTATKSSPMIKKSPVLSNEDIVKLSESIKNQLISEYTTDYCKELSSKILENAKFQNSESNRILENLYLGLVTEVVTSLAVKQNSDKRSVTKDLFNELLEEMIEEFHVYAENFVNEKKHNAESLKFFQKKYYFRCWFRHSKMLMTARKSLANINSTPRLTDSFSICEGFRGKVRKISTSWFESKDVYWHQHPVIARMERMTDSSDNLGVIVEKQLSSTQTMASNYNKKQIRLTQFIKSFIKLRVIDVLDIQLEVLKLAGKVDPTPERIISDYNKVVDDASFLIESKSSLDVDLARLLKLPLINITPDIQTYNQNYLEKILTDLEIAPYQQKYYINQGNDIFQQLNININYSYFHLRLFPWINIIKKAIITKLDRINGMLSDVTVEVEMNRFDFMSKLRLECISDEISVQQCVHLCVEKQNQLGDHPQIAHKNDTQKRSLLFNDIRDKIHLLQDKINECKENF